MKYEKTKKKSLGISSSLKGAYFDGFIAGYKANKARFTEEDMIDFAEWYIHNTGKFTDDTSANRAGEYLKIYNDKFGKYPQYIVVENNEIKEIIW